MSDMKKYLKAVTKLNESFDPSVTEAYVSKDYGIRYKVFAGREGRLTTKEKWFATAAQLAKFAEKVENLGNFYEIEGYSYPRSNDALGADPVAEGRHDEHEWVQQLMRDKEASMAPANTQTPKRYKLIQAGNIINSFDTVDQATTAWQQLPPSEKGRTKIRENVNGVDVDVIMEMDAGATCSASIATAPAESVFDKPQKRVSEDDEDGDSDFVGEPYKRDDADEELTETIKAAFEDYVKGKDTDEKCKVKITYKDGHSQTKLVTDKEKSRYETSASVDRVEVVKDGAARLDDAITESAQVTFIGKFSKDGKNYALWQKGDYWYELTRSSQDAGGAYKHVHEWHDTSVEEIQDELKHLGFSSMATKPEGRKYGVGDKVKISNDQYSNTGKNIGSTFKIIALGITKNGQFTYRLSPGEFRVYEKDLSPVDEVNEISQKTKNDYIDAATGDYADANAQRQHDPENAGEQEKRMAKRQKGLAMATGTDKDLRKVSEGPDTNELIQQLEDMSERIYQMTPGRAQRQLIKTRDDLEDKINSMPGGPAALSAWGKAYNDSFDESVVNELDNGPKGRVTTDKINYDARRGGDIAPVKDQLEKNKEAEEQRKAERAAANAAYKSSNNKASRLADKQTERIELNTNVPFSTIAKLARDYAGVNDIADIIDQRTYYTKIDGTVVAGIELTIYASYDPSDFGLEPDEYTENGLSDSIRLRFARDPKNPRKIIFTGYGA